MTALCAQPVPVHQKEQPHAPHVLVVSTQNPDWDIAVIAKPESIQWQEHLLALSASWVSTKRVRGNPLATLALQALSQHQQDQ